MTNEELAAFIYQQEHKNRVEAAQQGRINTALQVGQLLVQGVGAIAGVSTAQSTAAMASSLSAMQQPTGTTAVAGTPTVAAGQVGPSPAITPKPSGGGFWKILAGGVALWWVFA